MVVHETYKGEGGWYTPAEVKVEEGPDGRKAVLMASGEELRVGPIEKMSKSKKNVVRPRRHHRELRRGYRALVHAVGFAARARRHLDGSRRRGRASFRGSACGV